jgi:hypothetical protein
MLKIDQPRWRSTFESIDADGRFTNPMVTLLYLPACWRRATAKSSPGEPAHLRGLMPGKPGAMKLLPTALLARYSRGFEWKLYGSCLVARQVAADLVELW